MRYETLIEIIAEADDPKHNGAGYSLLMITTSGTRYEGVPFRDTNPSHTIRLLDRVDHPFWLSLDAVEFAQINWSPR